MESIMNIVKAIMKLRSMMTAEINDDDRDQ